MSVRHRSVKVCEAAVRAGIEHERPGPAMLGVLVGAHDLAAAVHSVGRGINATGNIQCLELTCGVQESVRARDVLVRTDDVDCASERSTPADPVRHRPRCTRNIECCELISTTVVLPFLGPVKKRCKPSPDALRSASSLTNELWERFSIDRDPEVSSVTRRSTIRGGGMRYRL
jgi:hypothetical protein